MGDTNSRPKIKRVDERTKMVLWQSFRHFVHMDEANAAMHTAPVRYSPITFRLAEVLVEDFGFGNILVESVYSDRGLYAEDPGR